MNEKVSIVQLDIGVPGLNEALGGGLPEYSFNLLAGGPGVLVVPEVSVREYDERIF